MTDRAYYRFPTVYRNTVIFTCEDDLWVVDTAGGIARRLTAGVGECSMPKLSPDGSLVAFAGQEEADSEIYIMPSEGGQARRLTHMGSTRCFVLDWSADGKEIYFMSDALSPFFKHGEIYAVPATGGHYRKLNIGHGVALANGPSGKRVIGRNNIDGARWKRYRGGTAGELWVDAVGKGNFERLLPRVSGARNGKSYVNGNLTNPMWVQNRVYFVSDHEGIGNIYSCDPAGADLRKYTSHKDYYVRFPSTDGRSIVYSAGGDIWLLNLSTGKSARIDVRVPASPRQSSRKFVNSEHYLEHFDPHPQSHSLVMIARGQPFTAPFWEEGVVQHGSGSIARYRHCQWLPDGERFVVVTDEQRFEQIEIHKADQSGRPVCLNKNELGRVIDLRVSPKGDKIAVSNHKHELLVIDIEKHTVKVLDRSPADRITGIDWSADGRWLAYTWSPYPNSSIIRVCEAQSGKPQDVTSLVRVDYSPSFDPEGKYLYFLSTRDFNPIYDAQQFDLSFPQATRPYLVTLRKDVPSPFHAKPKSMFGGGDKPPVAEPEKTPHGKGETQSRTKSRPKVGTKKAAGKKSGAASKSMDSAVDTPAAIEIDFDGIQSRILAFNVDEGIYDQVIGSKGRALYTLYPLRSIKRDHSWYDSSAPSATLYAWDFEENRQAPLAYDVSSMVLGHDTRTLIYRSKNRLRVIDAHEKIPESYPLTPSDTPGRKSGWIDLARFKILIEPEKEWQQMFDEAWRLQTAHFWDESMSQVDWALVYERYAPLVKRVRSRRDLSDLIWEMQGELGTSHAYEMGGDYRRPHPYYKGFLGAELEFDRKSGGYKITTILRGDSWDPTCDSPLARPGLGVAEGDIILAIGGRRTSADLTVDELLVNQYDQDITLTVLGADGKKRNLSVRTLKAEDWLRYRHWVESNRQYVHKRTKGRIGYLHIPDMGPTGFAEFHRGYLSEINREGLVVDVRYNGGGHVSPLLLEKLARKRVGYDVSRWGVPVAYPPESVAGPIVAVTNQFAGSDGDIFSHCFKLYNLGTLVGKRTWGGVIGIWPRHRLVDGTVTTQPEFSFWFCDVGWKVENYGTDPDVEVDIAPQDYKSGRDPQLDKAIEIVSGNLHGKPFRLPDFTERPSLPLPGTTSSAKPARKR